MYFVTNFEFSKYNGKKLSKKNMTYVEKMAKFKGICNYLILENSSIEKVFTMDRFE